MIITGSIIAGILVLLGISTVRIVPQKKEQVVETLGVGVHVLKAGPGLKLPFPVAIVRKEVDMKIFQLAEPVGVRTKDDIFVKLPVTLHAQVIDSKGFTYSAEDPKEKIKDAARSEILKIAGGMSVDEIYQGRNEILAQAKQHLDKVLEERFGVKLVDVLIGAPELSEEVRTARQLTQIEQKRLEASRLTAEQNRIRIVEAAKADAEAKEQAGIGMAKMREAMAEGMAVSMDKLEKAFGSREKAADAMLQTLRIDAIREAGREGNLIITDVGGASASSLGAEQAALVASILESKKRPDRPANANGGTPGAQAS